MGEARSARISSALKLYSAQLRKSLFDPPQPDLRTIKTRTPCLLESGQRYAKGIMKWNSPPPSALLPLPFYVSAKATEGARTRVARVTPFTGRYVLPPGSGAAGPAFPARKPKSFFERHSR